jgi:hypothetical protein
MRHVPAILVTGLTMFILAGLYTGLIARSFMTANVDTAKARERSLIRFGPKE